MPFTLYIYFHDNYLLVLKFMLLFYQKHLNYHDNSHEVYDKKRIFLVKISFKKVFQRSSQSLVQISYIYYYILYNNFFCLI